MNVSLAQLVKAVAELLPNPLAFGDQNDLCKDI